MRCARLAAVLLALTGLSCATLPFPEPHLEGDYGKALKRWTRAVALYSGLESRAFVRMVYLSPEFVAAQAAELSRMHAEQPDQAAKTLEKLREEDRQPTFFAVTYVPDANDNDWESKDSVWRIALNVGTGEVAPEKVVRYDKPFNAELRALYPYLDEYSTAYLIRFPVPPQPAQRAVVRPLESFIPPEVHVVVASALGRMTFNWRTDGGPEQPSTAEEGSQQKPETTPKPP